MSPNPITNFKDNYGADLGNKLISKEYLLSVYPGIAQQIGRTPELWTWGGNSSGRLGINNTDARSTPVTTFAGGSEWQMVSVGQSFTLAIKTDGTLWTWGYQNADGQLGINVSTTVNRLTPVTVFGGGSTNWKYVSAGDGHSAAIKTDGTLWLWGSNSVGQLGNNTTTVRRTPVQTSSGGTNWKYVDVGPLSSIGGNPSFTAAIKTDGTLWTWGYGRFGQLGINVTTNRSNPVTTFAGGNNWKQVSCAELRAGAIKTDGTLWMWGSGGGGSLGNNSISSTLTPVTTFAGGTNWKFMSATPQGTTALKTDGTLWTWGYGTSGRLGTNDTINRSTPVTTFAGGTNWKNLGSRSANLNGAIKTDGSLWVWGANTSGVLGINSTENKSTPITTFAGGNNWKRLSANSSGAAAIESSDFI